MILVTGATGQLGTAFRKLLPSDSKFVTRVDLDLSRPDYVRPFIERTLPDTIINCAAYTAVDRAETNAEETFTVNSRSVEALAAVAGDIGARLVTFSTDYVFDGSSLEPYTESAPTNPINVYGASKLEGEQRALAVNPDVLVIRTSWLLSGSHSNFASTMLRLMREGPVQVVNDQRGNPTLVDDLAPATMAAVEARVTDVLHLANQGTVSWYELARQISDFAGLPAVTIEPCTTDAFPRPARRPANSALVSERLRAAGLQPLPPYQPALKAALNLFQ